MPLDISRVRHYLNSFEFEKLFNELGWSLPPNPRPLADRASGIAFVRREIANLSGVVVLEITTDDGALADAKTREIIQRKITDQYRENLLIFLDQRRERRQPTASAWYWVKIDGGKRYRRTQTYFYGQPGDLLISQLSPIFFDITEFDAEGNVKLVEVARRLQEAFDIEPVTKAFYAAFKDQHQKLVDAITGIDDERERRWYASVLLNRLMFVYFLQRKGFLNRGDVWYLQNQLAQSKARGHDRFYGEFLTTLFFEGFAKDEGQRNELAQQLLGSGTIRYLNGGLFLPHHIEQTHDQIAMPDRVFDELFDLFKSYQWNLDDTPGGNDREINPAVLGYIFEKYINQKAFGAYYTRSEITNYICEQTIHKLILDKINPTVIPAGAPVRRYESLDELLARLDAGLCAELLFQILPNLALLDPARYWVDEQEGRKALLGRKLDVGQRLNYQGYRIAHRSIARNTDERTLIATVLRPNTFFGHSINASINSLTAKNVLFVTALLNSVVVDFLLRQRVSANITMFYIYGLDEAEFSHILSTFPLVAPAVKDATLQACRAFAPNPDDEQVARLIAGGEVDRVEFKVGAAWNPVTNAKDGTMRNNIVQAVAGFMNSFEGGTLLIGVADSGAIEGLANDYQAADPGKPNRDGYALFLNNLLSNSMGRDLGAFYSIHFHAISGKDVCRIVVEPAPKPVYLGNDLYVRNGNQKSRLSAREAIEYVKQRWGH